jgi:hypothetical protein
MNQEKSLYKKSLAEKALEENSVYERPLIDGVHETLEPSESYFGLDRMEPQQIAALAGALGLAYDVARNILPDSPDGSFSSYASPEANSYAKLRRQLDADLRHVARTSPRALDVYSELLAGDLSTDSSQNAAAEMAFDLLHRYADNPDMKKQLVDSIVALLHEEIPVSSSETREYHKEMALGKATVLAHRVKSVDWLDEPTKQYLLDQLPAR